MTDQVDLPTMRAKYTSTGRQSGWQIDLYHKGLREHKHLSAQERYALEGKVSNQLTVWGQKWDKECALNKVYASEKQAIILTKAAHEKIEAIEDLLAHTLKVNDAISWDTLVQDSKFFMSQQKDDILVYNRKTGYPEKIVEINSQILPHRDHFNTRISFWDKLFGRTETIVANDEQMFQLALDGANKVNARAQEENEKREIELLAKQRFWKLEEVKFLEQQEKHNSEVAEFKKKYEAKDPDAVVEYNEMVLENAIYPEQFPKTFEMQLNPETGVLLLDYQLPAPEHMPKVNNVKFVKSRQEYEQKYLSNADQAKLFDMAVYQIALRTLHEIFEADVVDAIKSINFNGFVTAINPTSGHEETNCIISLHAKKEDFLKINLKGIVASKTFKECFKSLKGVGSSKLISLSSVKPLMEMNKSDKRFRDHYAVADNLNEELNIAAMDWQDFEHLIREIFAKEFTENGGEVKVTQASADGGVDAIAFDPDPIRGGKIVIQAKRYTNVVGVSAVRDLYGTVMNEGATKGILVTTSDFGPDSYEFAKGKPLTLLSGSNLLYLLEKHGHKAKIDIKEAKRILKDQAA